MQEDVARIYSANIRLTSDAYDLLLHASISPSIIARILRSDAPIVDVDFIRACIAEESKIPSPSSSLPRREEKIPPRAATTSHQPTPKPIVQQTSAQPPSSSETKAAEPLAKSLPQPPAQIPATSPVAPETEPSKSKIPQAEPPLPAPEIEPAPAASTEETITEEAALVLRRKSFRPIAAEYSPKLTIFDNRDVSGQSRCTGTVDDFVKHFRDRFERESVILRQRPSNTIIARTDQLGAHREEDVRIICMVAEKRITSKGNLLLELEDEQGRIKALVSQNEKCFKDACTLLKDDVVAMDGRMSNDWFMVKMVTWPDIPVIRPERHSEVDVATVYLSDIHVGSKNFIEKSFRKFIRWLWGEEGNVELAGKVKYVCIAGDVCDGIGIYPNQEKELLVKDIYAQYAMFDELVSHFPDHIVTIVGPGNHDAVRRGEPQPYIPMDMIKSDVKKIGSPAALDIEGLRHIIYHGTSLDSIISNIPGMNYAHPEKPMEQILKRRHLSPIYGENLIVPEHRDYMLIEDEPDVLHMGHVHKNAASKYRGTYIINSGTFQSRTEFQVKMGHVPSPGIVPVLEMKSGNLSHLTFLGD